MRDREGLLATPPPVVKLAPASFDPADELVYRRALDALGARGVRVLVGGGLALNAYTGVWRWTKDVDLFLVERDLEPARRALEGAGFDYVVIHGSWLSKALLGEAFVDLIHRGANGLYRVDEDWHRAAKDRKLLGRECRIVAPEDLLLSKVFVANRNRFDGADVLHLIFRAHREIDWDRLLVQCEQHAGLVLAYVHLYRWAYPAFRDAIPARIVRSLERRAERMDKAPPFRGRLLDLMSFAVDVEGFGLPDPHEDLVEGYPHG